MPVVINLRPSVPSPLPPFPALEVEKNENGVQTSAPESCTESTRKRGRRGQHFDKAVERLSPYLAEARQAGHQSEEAMVNYLNGRGVPPTGKLFTAGSMHRVLVRERELKKGPRTAFKQRRGEGETIASRAGCLQKKVARLVCEAVSNCDLVVALPWKARSHPVCRRLNRKFQFSADVSK
jgi:hypothetical protein